MGFNPSKAASTERAAKLFVRDLVLDFGDGVILNVSVRLNAGQNPLMQERIEEVTAKIAVLDDADTSGDEHIGVLQAIVEDLAWVLDRFIASWDGTDDDGNPSPCDYDTLVSYPAEALIVVFGVLMEAFQDLIPKATKKTSGSSKRSKK